jgi:branched-chain amino acid aminotransferase
MAFPGTGKIWMNGKLIDWKDANVHIATHVIHYGSAVFEGARCYATPRGSACFRLDAHMRRLQQSAKIYRMDYDLDLAGWNTAVLDTIRANEMKACYIRPIVYRGYDSLGVNPLTCPVDAAILLWEWGAYLGKEALEEGVDVKVVAHGAEHAAGDGQERRQLRELGPDQDGGAGRRLLRRDRT